MQAMRTRLHIRNQSAVEQWEQGGEGDPSTGTLPVTPVTALVAGQGKQG